LAFPKNKPVLFLPVIGLIDIIVALIILIKPIRITVLWATIWAFSASLIRPISGETVFVLLKEDQAGHYP
jgi:hypothetical protein